MFGWLIKLMERRIRRKAENDTMRECGVSREYIQAVVANYEDWASGKITFQEWVRRAMQIAYRYPKDSRVKEILEESEFGV